VLDRRLLRGPIDIDGDYNYTLKTFKADGSASRVWSFEANDDDEAKAKAARYLREQAVPPEETLELRRERGRVLIGWEELK
jgi:hypothetical protein